MGFVILDLFMRLKGYSRDDPQGMAIKIFSAPLLLVLLPGVKKDAQFFRETILASSES